MRLQSVIIPADEQYADLYFRGHTQLASGGCISLDTYYNSFSYTKYREYTTVKHVSFSCNFIGSAQVELCMFDGDDHTLCSGEFNEHAELTVDISSLPERGFLYPKITALTPFIFGSGEYTAECEPRKISCCIAICTYKRENYVLKNTALLGDYTFSMIDRVFVIDNGNTINSTLSDDFVYVLPNRNFGGSGGFTRGLIEAKKGGFTHVILMDDDVEFHPETLEQMTIFMSLLKEQYELDWFSAGMVKLDTPWIQHELGAFWDGNAAIVNKMDLDIRDRRKLLENLDTADINYGGWWTLCMPVSVTQNGLPYPFFIKFDDVEYGLRKRAECQIITMNGIAVRHEAFDKKTSFVLDYYNLRNQLVVNALYYQNGGLSAVKLFMKSVLKQVVLYRYDNIDLIIRAVNDFLSGVDFFLNTDEEQLNAELIKTAPKLIPLTQIPQWNDSMRCDEHEKDLQITPLMWLTAGGHIIPSFLLHKDVAAVPLSRASAKDFFGRRAVIQYQLGGSNGVYTKRNFAKFVSSFLRAVFTSVKLLFKYKSVKKDYIHRRSILTSDEYWVDHLGI